jgi:predicted membrane metal-binding protein
MNPAPPVTMIRIAAPLILAVSSQLRYVPERTPLLLLGAAAAFGAAAALPFSLEARGLTLCACVVLCGWIALARPSLLPLRACAAVALGAGWSLAALHVSAAAPGFTGKTARIACTVLDPNGAQDSGSSFICAADDGTKLAVTTRGSLPNAGARVLLRGRIESFDGPRNPGEPDQRAIERERGITARIGNAQILRLLPARAPTLDVLIARAHEWALAQLRARLAEPSATILAGELWGERSALPPELRTEFQETGTVHVLVTAGLHLGVVAALTLLLLRFFSTPRLAACALTIGAIWVYAVFSGLHLPAMRAATMISFALMAYACGRATRA